MRNLTIYVTLALLCTIAFTGQSADIPNKQNSKFEIAVLVECDDKNMKAFIESHIKRELRSIRDVDVSALDLEMSDFMIGILAVETENIIAVSYTFTDFWNDDDVEWLRRGTEFDNDTLKFVLNHQLGTRTHQYLQISMRWNLEELCKQVIVNFDTEMLKPDRNGK